MKALFIVFDQELQHELDFILRANQIENYSRLDDVRGKGGSGLKEGNAIGPGLNHIYWIVLEDKAIEKFLRELKEFKTHKLKNKGIQVFVLPVETAF